MVLTVRGMGSGSGDDGGYLSLPTSRGAKPRTPRRCGCMTQGQALSDLSSVVVGGQDWQNAFRFDEPLIRDSAYPVRTQNPRREFSTAVSAQPISLGKGTAGHVRLRVMSVRRGQINNPGQKSGSFCSKTLGLHSLRINGRHRYKGEGHRVQARGLKIA